MRIHLLAAGTRMPWWVSDGFHDYARRLPRGWLQLTEVALARGAEQADSKRALAAEWSRLHAAIPPAATIVALDVNGKPWSTAVLVGRLRAWMMARRDIALLIGGPHGLHRRALEAATDIWSLSALTLPHALVRVVVAEQIYRAWTVVQNHPYHRA